ncbi:NAD-dependent epimerase/dehydratase family protein [Candidatus Actinomarina]|nr:NAD-dependent epimerase/dehydratase family protein [Candidatus Actinomarina sp.]
MNNKIIISGTAGFIGFNLAKKLMDMGFDVVGVDSLNDAYDVRLKNLRISELNSNKSYEFHELNLSNPASISHLQKLDTQAQTFFHMAARAGVRQSFLEPYKYVLDNTVATTNVANFCKVTGVPSLILASTSSIYGDSGENLMREHKDERIQPPSVYASTKLSGEILAKTILDESVTKVLIPRFFTVYGPYGRPDMSILRFIHWIINKQEVQVFGNGEQRRSFTYIDDVVSALVKVMNHNSSDTFNIGSNNTVSLNRVIEIIEESTDIKSVVVNKERAIKDPDVVKPDLSHIKQTLDWEPTTLIEQGVQKTVEWYLENIELLKSLNYIKK